jgi:LmbE family N-acetylglucosaminyl deacetylase
MPEPEFRPELLLEVLARHGVRHVLIGGFAGVIHGSPYVTTDVDVVPDDDPANLERLSAALDDLHARVWTANEPDGVHFDHDATSLAAVRVWNLVTDHGRLDIVFEPSGTAGYKDVARDAVSLVILGTRLDVASLADVVRSKEASGRDKDRLVLPVLRRILAETER